MRTILVSGASGVVGYGILKSLRRTNSLYRLIGTTIYDISIAPHFCDYVVKMPHTSEENYMDELVSVIKRYNVDAVIPSIEIDMFKWNDNRQRILESGAMPILNNSDLIDAVYDKWGFYTILNKHNPDYAIPTTLESDYFNFTCPFILKPRRGFGSKGIVRVDSVATFLRHEDKIGHELMMQPLIGTDDEEYTVSAFFDRDSHLIDYFPLKRKLSSDGFTNQAEVVGYDFRNDIETLAETFKPIGATNFQFRLDGTMKLLEINPRISSATSIRSLFGYNEARMSLDYFLDSKLSEKNDYSIFVGKKIIRYQEDYIL